MSEDDLLEVEERIKYYGRLGVRDSRALVAEVRRLWARVDALHEYGRHKDGCVFWLDDESDLEAYGPNGICTCGFHEALLP